MTVVFLNRSYWPDQAATGQLLTELAEDLVHVHGCDVTVVAGRTAAQTAASPTRPSRWTPVTEEEHNGVRIYRAAGTTLSKRRFIGRALNYITYFLSACWAALRVPKADVVVTLTDPPIIGLAALIAARRSGARFVFLCQDVFPEVTRLLEDFHSPTVDRALDRVSRLLVRRADRIVALGETMKDRLVRGKGAEPGKVVVIHNWADCSAIRPAPKDNAFSRANGLVDRFVVMHSGNVGLSQNLDMLLDAAARLRSHPDIVFAIVGDGTQRHALEARAATEGLNNVLFIPYQPKEALIDSFAAADVFIVSLKPGLEGCIVPSKVYGILAAGRSFIAAIDEDCEAATIARTYGCGLVVPPGDSGALASRILELAQDRSRTAAMGARARSAALAFDRQAQVGRYYRLFERDETPDAPAIARMSLPAQSMTGTRLIIVEGIMGSGKSSVSRFLVDTLRRSGVAAHAYGNPANGMRRPPDVLRHMLRELPDRELIWGRVTPASLMQRSRLAWERFVARTSERDEVCVFDGRFFNGDVAGLVMLDVPEARLMDHVAEIADVARPLHPCLVYLHHGDVDRGLRRIADLRGRRWLEAQVGWKTKSPYCVRRSLTGFDGWLALYRSYRQICGRLLPRLGLPHVEIDVSAGDWAAHHERILGFVSAHDRLPRLCS